MGPRLSLGAAQIGVGLMLILVSLPLVYEKIPRNYFYGFRIPQAFRSDEDWYDINRYGGRQIILWSLPLCLSGALMLILPLEVWNVGHDALIWFSLGPIMTFSLVPVVTTLVYAVRRDRRS